MKSAILVDFRCSWVDGEVKGEVVRTANAASDCVDPILLPHCSRAGKPGHRGADSPDRASAAPKAPPREPCSICHIP